MLIDVAFQFEYIILARAVFVKASGFVGTRRLWYDYVYLSNGGNYAVTPAPLRLRFARLASADRRAFPLRRFLIQPRGFAFIRALPIRPSDAKRGCADCGARRARPDDQRNHGG
jgi:hypothetical protein